MLGNFAAGTSRYLSFLINVSLPLFFSSTVPSERKRHGQESERMQSHAEQDCFKLKSWLPGVEKERKRTSERKTARKQASERGRKRATETELQRKRIRK